MLGVLPPTFRPVNNLIFCKTGLMWVVKRNITIQLLLQQCCKTSCTFFVARFSVTFNTALCLLGGTAETQTSNQDQVDAVSVMVRMNNTVNILKEGSYEDIVAVVEKVAKDILQPYEETDDRELRQKYGDHLAEIDAPLHLTKLLQRLMDMGMETKNGWLGMLVVRSVFWNYSDASLRMARGLGRSGLLKIVLNDLDTYGARSFKNEASPEFVMFPNESIKLFIDKVFFLSQRTLLKMGNVI